MEFSALFIYVLPFQVKFCLNTVEDINAELAASQFEELPQDDITLIELIESMCLIVLANHITQSNEELEQFHNHINSNIMYTSSQGLLSTYHIHRNDST